MSRKQKILGQIRAEIKKLGITNPVDSEILLLRRQRDQLEDHLDALIASRVPEAGLSDTRKEIKELDEKIEHLQAQPLRVVSVVPSIPLNQSSPRQLELFRQGDPSMKKNPFLHQNSGRRLQWDKDAQKSVQKSGRPAPFAPYQDDNYLFGKTVAELVRMGTSAAKAELQRRERDPQTGEKLNLPEWLHNYRASKGGSRAAANPSALMNAGRRTSKSKQKEGRPAPYAAPKGPKVGTMAKIHDTDLRAMSSSQLREMASPITYAELERREREHSGKKSNTPEWLKKWKGGKAASNPKRDSQGRFVKSKKQNR